MLECIICSKDCIDEYYVKCELCSDCTHIICLHEAKAIKSKFPNGNSPPKYICEILSSSYFVFKCNKCIDLPLENTPHDNNEHDNLSKVLESNNILLSKIDKKVNDAEISLKKLSIQLSDYSKKKSSYTDISSQNQLAKSISKEISIS